MDKVVLMPFTGTPWPDPEPLAGGLLPVPALAPDMLPDALAGYVFDVADRTQCPPDFVAVGALCACGALVGNRVRIHPKHHDDWLVTPNLWGAIIGPPSAMKSPALKYALSPLYTLEREARELFDAEKAQAEAAAEVAKLALEDAKGRAKAKVKAGDKAAARDIIADAQRVDVEQPVRRRLIVNDATVEKLGELLNENPRGLLMIRDELPGLLAKLESEEFQVDRAFYLESFNGDSPFIYDRIGRGTVEIGMATLSLVGGVQPARIAPIVRGAVTGASADGLMQRLQLTVWPDLAPDWQWRDRGPDPAAMRAYADTFRALDAIASAATGDPVCLRFTPGAQALFAEWTTELQHEVRSGRHPEAVEAHFLKMQKTVPSLALVFALIDGAFEHVTEAALWKAIMFVEYLKPHALRLYASGSHAAEAGAKLILARRDALPAPFRARDVHQKAWAGLSDRGAVDAALKVLADTHHIRSKAVEPRPAGGRPTEEFIWNPKLAGGAK